MSKEFIALSALRSYLATQIEATPYPAIVDGQVVIGYPDVDSMRYDTMFYIVPEGGSWEVLTTQSLEESLSVKLYMLAKPTATLNTMSKVIQALLEYFAALRNALNTDPTMGGSYDEAVVTSYDFYPAVEGLTDTVGLDISMELKFEVESLVLPESDIYPGEDVHPVGG